MQIQTELRQNAIETEQKLQEYLPQSEFEPVLRYCLLQGGKRLRPFLVRTVAKSFGTADENVWRLACAAEMIHSYSLVHDDLPCMDNDDFRRGRPSCHKAFGEANAVLAGDALLNLAFETLLNGQMRRGYRKACAYLASCAGTLGMIAGQVLDLAPEKPWNAETLQILTERKTAKLIEAAAVAPALYCEADEATVSLLRQWAKAFGKAFQIKDDLQDGAEEGKLTFVTLFGETGAYELLRQTSEEAIQIAEELRLSSLRELTEYNRSR